MKLSRIFLEFDNGNVAEIAEAQIISMEVRYEANVANVVHFGNDFIRGHEVTLHLEVIAPGFISHLSERPPHATRALPDERKLLP